jgi:preprotein translocase subunit SecA
MAPAQPGWTGGGVLLNAILAQIIGTRNERELKAIRPVVQRIGEFEASILPLTDDALRAKTVEFKARLAQGASLDDSRPRPSPWWQRMPVLNMRHFDVHHGFTFTGHYRRDEDARRPWWRPFPPI